MEEDEKEKKGEKDIQLSIQSTKGTKEFSFPKETKVTAVIEEAIRVFEFAPGDRFELVFADRPEEALHPERTLVSYHIEDGTLLILTAVGGGV